VLENIVINYLILLVTARFTKSRTTSLRLLAGAAIGASFVVIMMLMPDIKAYGSIIAKLFLSAVIVAVSFNVRKISSFFKILIVFYISTFVFAGAALAFTYFVQGGGFIKNGILWPIKAKLNVVLFAAALAVILARVFWEVIQQRLVRAKMLVRLVIAFEKRTIGLHALVDTGNSLHDPLTNMPVVVVEFSAIKGILPEEIRKIFEEFQESDLERITSAITASTWFSRFRLIPFTSLGKENGMLIGFKPDYIEISKDSDNNENKDVSDVIVGIYGRSLSKNEKYKALLGPELI
jgi:stage II sporulation protein GA (sporulation sigma-E factor processing peptidase)